MKSKAKRKHTDFLKQFPLFKFFILILAFPFTFFQHFSLRRFETDNFVDKSRFLNTKNSFSNFFDVFDFGVLGRARKSACLNMCFKIQNRSAAKNVNRYAFFTLQETNMMKV